MIVGILSDTHGRGDAMAEAVRLLTDAGAEFLIHCGDVGGEAVIDHLAGSKALLIWGNNDWERAPLTRYAEALGITVGPSLAEVELDGKRFAVTHGDDSRLVRRVLDEQRHDYLLLGHSHVRRDSRIGRVRMINPGALHRAIEKTVAILDTTNDALRFIPVPCAQR
jgi:uncharacterized protein